jgi:hypothetical protein
MKRDMELIVEILKYIEVHLTTTNNIIVELDGYDHELVQYQVGLMKDAGFIEAKRVLNPSSYYISKMSWDGHDFLDAARNQVIVNKAKDIVKREGAELFKLPIHVIKEVLIKAATDLFLS